MYTKETMMPLQSPLHMFKCDRLQLQSRQATIAYKHSLVQLYPPESLVLNLVSRWRGVKEVRWNRLSEPLAWGAILVTAEEVPKLIVDITRRPIKCKYFNF